MKGYLRKFRLCYHLSKFDISIKLLCFRHSAFALTSNGGMHPRRSEVAAGGIGRFIPIRLCSSQILSIQDLFQTSVYGKRFEHQHFRVGTFVPSHAFQLSGLSSPHSFTRRGAIALLPRATYII